MAQINQVYEEGDIETLLEILNNWDEYPLSIKEKSIEAKIERINREIALLQKRIEKINNQIIELKESDIYLLKNRVETENEFHKDILQDMATSIEEEIEELRLELEQVKYMCKIAQILESQLKILMNPKLYKLTDIQWKGKYCTNVMALCIIMTQYKLNEDENNIIREYLTYKSEQLVK